ncbi:MAG: hypothetical protein M3O50_05125 [Myxococcota bacterium]|nr:hypothetical protein [Myxococcota bacterium]
MPLLDPLRLEEHVHGHLGWLAAAALVHPAILLRRPRRRAHVAVGLAVALVSVTGVLGVLLYGPYRDTLRQPLFARSAGLGYLFERKEHLAFGALLLAWAGAIAYAAELRADGSLRDSLRRVAQFAFVAAAALAALTAALGTVVAAYSTF